MSIKILKELERRKNFYKLIPQTVGKDHTTELTRLYSELKEVNTRNSNDLIDFILNSFDFSVLDNVYKIILKQSFGVFPLGNISQKEGICFFVSLGARPHVPAHSEVPMMDYFKKHDRYFHTKISNIINKKKYTKKTVPLHHVIWMLSREKSFSWITLRKYKVSVKKNLFEQVSYKLIHSINFLRQFGKVRVSIAIGYNGSENKLHNCQSLGAPHFHVTVVTPKEKIKPKMIIPNKNQLSMYINSYLILITRFKLDISELIRLKFKLLQSDIKVIVKENSLDLFNQIVFEICFKKSQDIGQVLFVIAKLERLFGLIWDFPLYKNPISKTFCLVKDINTKIKDLLKNSYIKKEFPAVPGFIVVLDIDDKNGVKKLKIAPAKHGPAEGQLGVTLKI